MKNFENYTTEDFIHDDYFIEWITRPTNRHDEFWKNIIRQYPEKKEQIKAARSVIKSLTPVSQEVPRDEIDDLWKMIENSTVSRVNLFRRYRYAVASIILIVLFTGSWWLYRTFSVSSTQIDYTQISAPPDNENEVKVILADESELKIQDEESNLLYNHGGKLIVNSVRQIDQNASDTSGAKLLLNQIMVPFGKRSAITFCDGTKIWINSGSRAIYPIEFDSRKREIYVEGEVFIDVAKDENKPFIVRTDKMDIKVLGTSFNVSSYPDDPNVTVVLVRGNIRIKPEDKKEIQVAPNQALVYSKQTREVSLNNVDIYNYISWKDGWLRCESEEIGIVINKLARYYNKKFIYNNQSVRSIHLSGKLDLKDSFEEVLNVISLTAPVKFDIENEIINVSEINN